MPESRIPSVLLIDDTADETLLLPLQHENRARIAARHPNEVEIGDIIDADLVLVDYVLEDWPERENIAQLAFKPMDGLALAALLRRHAQKIEGASPVAFALFSERIADVAWPLPAETRLHALAALSGLEWVFEKGKSNETDTLLQIASLAEAVTELPQAWPIGKSESNEALDLLAELLMVGGSEELKAQLRREVQDCLPPLHDLWQWSHGLALLRWLLQRILPYPTFLLSTIYLAARLRVDSAELEESLKEGNPLRAALAESEYAGILRSFCGPRWWRAAVELWLFDELGARSADDDAVYELTCKAAKNKLQRSSPTHRPVVCLNSLYEPIDHFSSTDDAVRIRPDDWPAFADDAWTSLELARAEPRLAALVLEDERPRLAQ